MARARPTGPLAGRAGALPAALLVFLVTAPVYLLTMARAIGFVDRGELAAVAVTLGVAHPTGYPTFTLLGHLATRLIPLPPVLALNVFAALLVAAGAGVMVLLFDHALARLDAALPPRRAGRRAPGAPASGAGPAWRTALAALAALATSLTATWWRQANGFEVYALHALFLPLVTLLFLRWVDGARTGAPAGGDPEPGSGHADATRGRGAAPRPAPAPARSGAVFALVLGLSFTNHMTTVLLAPAFLATFFAASGAGRAAWARLLGLAPWFAFGLLPYLWLPLRARMHPLINWGDPETFHRFFAHVSAWQFRVWMFTDPDTFRQQTTWFFRQLPGDLSTVGLLAALPGLALLLRARARLGVFALLLFAATILYAGNYQIRDIDSYYMTAILALGLCGAAGLLLVLRRLGPAAAVAFGATLVALNGFLHWRACDESGNRLVVDLTENMLGSLPRNSVLISSQWDYTSSAGYYVQGVERFRSDVLMLDPELMRRSWYLAGLAGRDPQLARAAAPEIARFQHEVQPFERERPYDADVIQSAYVGMIDALLERAMERGRPVFVTREVSPEIGARWRRIPVQLALELRPDSNYVPQEFPRWRFRPWQARVDPYVATTHLIYGQAAAARMMYEGRFGRLELARRYGRYALTFDPGLRAQEVPPLPLDGPEITAQSIRFFDVLRDFAPLRAPQPPALPPAR
ncbi:MAG: DUF2723 domain-containing protein [Candidatus Eisenbacteria bacterium]|nr:DUF2723 domain-containing protein [Candidatus Eisenbacteria bacterium]